MDLHLTIDLTAKVSDEMSFELEREFSKFRLKLWTLFQVASAIASIEVTSEVAEDGNVRRVSKVKFWSKTTALDSLAKWRRMFVELQERGKPGEFDHLSREEVKAELEMLEAAAKARGDAATLETQTNAAPGVPVLLREPRPIP